MEVKFDSGKKADMRPTQIEYMVLLGGFKPGERVVSRIDWESAAGKKLTKGDVGTVNGPCSDGDETRIEVSFDELTIDLAPRQIEYEPLIGGFRKNERVLSKIDWEQSKLKKGGDWALPMEMRRRRWFEQAL